SMSRSGMISLPCRRRRARNSWTLINRRTLPPRAPRAPNQALTPRPNSRPVLALLYAPCLSCHHERPLETVSQPILVCGSGRNHTKFSPEWGERALPCALALGKVGNRTESRRDGRSCDIVSYPWAIFVHAATAKQEI